MLHRCVRSPFQLLLNRMEGLAVEVDVAERGAPGCAVVIGRLLIVSTTALALSVLWSQWWVVYADHVPSKTEFPPSGKGHPAQVPVFNHFFQERQSNTLLQAYLLWSKKLLFTCWTDFILGGSKITADGDCSHEIKRRLLLGRKVMTNLDSVLKSRDTTLPTKVHLVKAVVFAVAMYGCESWTIRKAEHRRFDAFKLWCWGRLLRDPWTARRSNQSILKEISTENSLEGLML